MLRFTLSLPLPLFVKLVMPLGALLEDFFFGAFCLQGRNNMVNVISFRLWHTEGFCIVLLLLSDRVLLCSPGWLPAVILNVMFMNINVYSGCLVGGFLFWGPTIL